MMSLAQKARLAPAAVLCLAASASPAFAQAAGGGILQPVEGVLQEIVDTLTGPLGVLIGALALIAIGVLWATGRLDVRAALVMTILSLGFPENCMLRPSGAGTLAEVSALDDIDPVKLVPNTLPNSLC